MGNGAQIINQFNQMDTAHELDGWLERPPTFAGGFEVNANGNLVRQWRAALLTVFRRRWDNRFGYSIVAHGKARYSPKGFSTQQAAVTAPLGAITRRPQLCHREVDHRSSIPDIPLNRHQIEQRFWELMKGAPICIQQRFELVFQWRELEKLPLSPLLRGLEEVLGSNAHA